MLGKKFENSYDELVGAFLKYHNLDSAGAALPELFEARMHLDTARLQVARHRQGRN